MGNPFSKGRYTQRVPNTQKGSVHIKRTHLQNKIDQVYNRQEITWGQKTWLRYYLKDLESLFRNYETDETKQEHFARIAYIIRHDWRITGRDEDTMELVQRLSKYHRVRPHDSEVASVYHMSEHLGPDDAVPYKVTTNRIISVRQTREDARRASTVRRGEIPEDLQINKRIRSVSTASHDENEDGGAGTQTVSERKEEDMTITTMNSMDIIHNLKTDDVVHVCKLSGRFAQIKFPVRGWIQAIDQHGNVLCERQGCIEDRAKYISTAQTLDREDESKHGSIESMEDLDFVNTSTFSANTSNIAMPASISPVPSLPENPELPDGLVLDVDDGTDLRGRNFSVHKFHPNYYKLDKMKQRIHNGPSPVDGMIDIRDANTHPRSRSNSADGNPVIVMSEHIPVTTDGRVRVNTNSTVDEGTSTSPDQPNRKKLTPQQRKQAQAVANQVDQPKMGYFEPLSTGDVPPSSVSPQTIVRFGEENGRQQSYKGSGDSLRDIPRPDGPVFSHTGATSVSFKSQPSTFSVIDAGRGSDSEEPVMGFMEPITGQDGDAMTGSMLEVTPPEPRREPEPVVVQPQPQPIQTGGASVNGEKYNELQGPSFDISAARNEYGNVNEDDEPVMVMGSAPVGDGSETRPHTLSPARDLNHSQSVPPEYPRVISEDTRLASAPLSGPDDISVNVNFSPSDGRRTGTTTPRQRTPDLHRPPSPMVEGRPQPGPAFAAPMGRAVSAGSSASLSSVRSNGEICRPGAIIQVKTSSLLNVGRQSDPIVSTDYAEKHKFVYGEVIATHEESMNDNGPTKMARVYMWPKDDGCLWDEPFAVNVPASIVERLPFELQMTEHDNRSNWGASTQVQLWSTEHQTWCDSEVRSFVPDLNGASPNDRLRVRGFLEMESGDEMVNATLERSSKLLRARCVGQIEKLLK